MLLQQNVTIDKGYYVLYDIETKSFLAPVLSHIQGTGNLVKDDGKSNHKTEMEKQVQALGKSVKGKTDLNALPQKSKPIRRTVTPKQGLYALIYIIF